MIRDRKNLATPIDFQIGNGKIGGTDIDFVLEFDGKHLILVELKKKGVDIPTGQRLLLERICDMWIKAGGDSTVLHCSWKTTDGDGYINLLTAKVVNIYWNGSWRKSKKNQGVVAYLNKIGEKWGCSKCKF